MEAIIAVVVVVGSLPMLCAVCGKVTKHWIRKRAPESHWQHYECEECHVIKEFRVK